jgi:hypothetical protein
MYRDFYNFIVSEANSRGFLLLHAELVQNNTKTLVCKEMTEGGIRKGEGGIWKRESGRRNLE